jgi:class 3 adenylate cyclase
VAELFVVNGVCGGTVFFLPDVPTVLGRSPECHIQVADAWISSMHALFERRGDELWVVDLDSRNGTFVDGLRIHEARVKPGMKLRFGKTNAELRLNAGMVSPQAVLSDQRTIIRYIADLAPEATSTESWEATSAHPTPCPGPLSARADTLSGEATAFGGPARRQIGIVNEICRSLLDAGNVVDALQRIVAVLGGALAADASRVLLLDEKGEMVPVVTHPTDAHTPQHRSVVEATLKTRAGVLTVEPPGDARAGTHANQPVRSCICAPIWADNRILGVILLDRSGLDPFTADDLDVATVVGFHAALAVERSRASERAEVVEEARQRLLRHLDPAVAARYLNSGDASDPLQPAAREDAAVLAVVVGGLGTLTHHRTPAEVAERALAVQRAIAGIARAEGAAVDERIDGGVMAVFGLAQPRPDAATVALRCARAMLERVTALESVFEGPRLHVRLGIETGRVVTGNFGLPNCPELRTVGEAVDTAARLAVEAAPGEALAGPGASKRSRRATDEALTMRADGSGALRIA